MKGQVSTELLVIVGLILLIFIPVLVMVYLKANDANQQIASYQAELAVFRLAYLANSVGSLGTSSSTYADVYIPKNVESFNLASEGGGGSIIMTVKTPEGVSEIAEIIHYPVKAGSLGGPENAGGWVKLKVSANYTSGKPEIQIEPA